MNTTINVSSKNKKTINNMKTKYYFRTQDQVITILLKLVKDFQPEFTGIASVISKRGRK